MDNKKKWQIPVLVLGVFLLAIFGFNAVRTMSGKPKVAVRAKNPEHIKKKPPDAEATPTVSEPVTHAAKPIFSGVAPAEQLASIQLPSSDPFAQLPAIRRAREAAQTPAARTPPRAATVTVNPAIPPPSALGPLGGLLSAAMGGAATGSGQGGEGPSSASTPSPSSPNVEFRGSVTGAGKQIAVVRTTEGASGSAPTFLTKGDSIGGGAASVEKIGQDGITISGPFGTEIVAPRQEETSSIRPPAAPGGVTSR